jgi:hypothetical protein
MAEHQVTPPPTTRLRPTTKPAGHTKHALDSIITETGLDTEAPFWASVS